MTEPRRIGPIVREEADRLRGGISGIGKRKPHIRRDWSLANQKVDEEFGLCRNCGTDYGVERAHVISREHDAVPGVRPIENWKPYLVIPDRIVPLCGPPTDPNSCHGKDHFNRLEWLPLLTLDEQIQAVADAGSIYRAMTLLSPSFNPKSVAA